MDPAANPFYHQAPPLMNQPPRIFGAVSNNGTPIPPQLTQPIFTPDDLDDGHDQGDAKRRRIARVRLSTAEEDEDGQR